MDEKLGPIFFGNERKEGYYIIYSQPIRGELNVKSLSEKHTLTWKLLASREAPEASRKFARERMFQHAIRLKLCSSENFRTKLKQKRYPATMDE